MICFLDYCFFSRSILYILAILTGIIVHKGPVELDGYSWRMYTRIYRHILCSEGSNLIGC